MKVIIYKKYTAFPNLHLKNYLKEMYCLATQFLVTENEFLHFCHFCCYTLQFNTNFFQKYASNISNQRAHPGHFI